MTSKLSVSNVYCSGFRLRTDTDSTEIGAARPFPAANTLRFGTVVGRRELVRNPTRHNLDSTIPRSRPKLGSHEAWGMTTKGGGRSILRGTERAA